MCAPGICEPSCTAVLAASSFTLEARGPQRTVGHVAVLEPSRTRRPGREPRDSTGSLLSREAGPEPWDTWQHRSSPRQEGEVQSCRACGGVGALLSTEVGSGAAGHVATSKPSSAGRRGRSCGTHVSTGALLSGEVVSRAVRHMVARGSSSCSLSWPHACMRGYPVCRVPTLALETTSGEVMNSQVGHYIAVPPGYSEFLPW
jgi:hypothetical protein